MSKTKLSRAVFMLLYAGSNQTTAADTIGNCYSVIVIKLLFIDTIYKFSTYLTKLKALKFSTTNKIASAVSLKNKL